MASKIRIKASIVAGLTTVQTVFKHPMHTGNYRAPDSDAIIPAFFIETVTIHHGSELVMSCDWSRAISKNPYLSFGFSGAKAGDSIRVSWRDSQGNTESKQALIR